MKQMEDAKKKYKEVPIPKELSERVEQAIHQAEILNKRKVVPLKKKKRIVGKGIAAAAVMAVVFTGVVNTDTALAETLRETPIIGELARVLTFRSYEEQKESGLEISVDIPSVEAIGKDTKLEKAINEEIRNRCQKYVAQAEKRAEEYKKAFLETGGTEEEWKSHTLELKVWYEIKSQTDNYLSFSVMGTESWNSANNVTNYYNVDLKNGKTVTLKDLLGENYIQIANESIQNQIQEREQSGQAFFTPEQDGFTTISEDTNFYINQENNPVITFKRYEIAPGSSGEPEFEIKPSHAEGEI